MELQYNWPINKNYDSYIERFKEKIKPIVLEWYKDNKNNYINLRTVNWIFDEKFKDDPTLWDGKNVWCKITKSKRLYAIKLIFEDLGYKKWSEAGVSSLVIYKDLEKDKK